MMCSVQIPLYFKTTLHYIGPKEQFSVLNDLYLKTTCNIRPHFLVPMDGLKIEGQLYIVISGRLGAVLISKQFHARF